MDIINRLLNSFIFWAAWIIIPLIMEIAPAIGSMFILQKRKVFPAQDRKPTIYPEITIIIPVYNSAQTLEASIRSVAESDYPDNCINIFLVNNMSKDNSFEIFTQCQKKFPTLMMRWMNAEQGKSKALNLALYNSSGKYIIHIDSDGVLEPSAIRHMVERFESDTSTNVMTGAICTNPKLIEQYPRGFSRMLRKLEFMEYAQAFLAGRNYASETNSIYTLSGAFSGFRKKAILNSWLYSTDTICEDTQITFQMKYIQKEKVKISEKSIFFVEPIEEIDKLYTQRQRWQRGSLEVSKLFGDNSLKPSKIMKDVNVRTLLYDHTFAFPRLIWYLALICLGFMGFSTKTILLSLAAIFALYILCGYFYFFAILGFLSEFKELKKYYRKQWWGIFFLPFFNFVVFFIRVAGIINMIGTDSAWKTKTLSEERSIFSKRISEDFSKLRGMLKKADGFFNQDPTVKKVSKPKGRIWYAGIGAAYLIAVLLSVMGYWVKITFGIGFSELIITLLSPIKGTGNATIGEIVKVCVPLVLAGIILYAAAAFFCRRRKNYIRAERIISIGAAVSLVISCLYVNSMYDVTGYAMSKLGQTMIYEQYYVDPRDVASTRVKEGRNLIYIQVESMETTYASADAGGRQDTNYIPGLTSLAEEYISFSDSEKLGGFHCSSNTNTTMASLWASTTGVPYSPEVTSVEGGEAVAPGIVSLGDILGKMGYQQIFLCGSDGEFGGRKAYFEQHGNYEVFDLYTARKRDYIADDYYVWWGFEDKILYDIAKDEIKRLAESGKPFNFTMLTVDTHHVDGYVCELCKDSYDSRTANVVSCADRQVTEFVEWCKTQDFYEDTVIIISGDHPRMDTSLVAGVSYYDRTVYNCFINAEPQQEIEEQNRIFTTMDMFPTILSAMGYKVEGDRLGLGTNLFSDQKTLAESEGFDWLEKETLKASDYFKENFLEIGQ